MSEEIVPNELPIMTAGQIKQRAQRIFDLRGKPPYLGGGGDLEALSDDELAVLSEFVHYWLPFLKHGS